MKVGKLGEEISLKIKSAIQAKLMELGIRIDNELPDYVMVLVANEKPQPQMERDLHLFLGDNTKAFADWLYDVLNKLERATVTAKSLKKKDDKKIKKRLSIEDENDSKTFENFKNQEQESNYALDASREDELLLEHEEIDFLDSKEKEKYIHDGDDSYSSKSKDNYENQNRDKDMTGNKQREKITIVWDEDKNKRNDKRRERSKSRDNDRNYRRKERDRRTKRDGSRNRSRSRTPLFQRRQEKTKDAREILSNKHRSKKSPKSRSITREDNKSKLSSVLVVKKIKEVDPPSIPSLVKVTPRPTRPPALQPSCNLILKAVAAAQKSIATSKITNLIEETEDKRPKRKERNSQNISITLLNRVTTSKIEPTHIPVFEKEEKNLKAKDVYSTENPDDFMESSEKETRLEKRSDFQRPAEKNPDRRFIITLDSTASDNEVENEPDSTNQEYESREDESQDIEMQIVKGFDRNRLGPKMETNTEYDQNYDSEMIFETNETVRADVQIRCKFWPNCTAGEQCKYHHPVNKCWKWPACPFKENCLNVHPFCKYGNICSNPTCQYSHQVPTKVIKPVAKGTVQVCKFYPKCVNLMCPYLHVSKPCKFGATCGRLGCEFSHPGQKTPFKWFASGTSQ